jgi:ribosomal protein S18 acetylase RimI-like enzyme
MTLAVDRDVADWWAVPATTLDYPRIADFLATTPGLDGRTFGSESRDVEEHFDGALEGGANVVLDDGGEVRGFALLRQSRGHQIDAEFVFDPAAPAAAVDEVIGSAAAEFLAEAGDQAAAFMRAIVGADQRNVIEALSRLGASREAEFVRMHKPLAGEVAAELATATIPGLSVLNWPTVISRGLGERVWRLHHQTFPEPLYNPFASREAFDRHVRSRAFTPDFSGAAVDGSGEVLGYVLGSTLTTGAAPHDVRSVHVDYIGVRADQRSRGIGELLVRKVWLAALRRGFTCSSLEIDVDNGSKAHRPYRRLGYVPLQSRYSYRIDAARDSP